MIRNQSILFRLMGSFAIIVTMTIILGFVGYFALSSVNSELAIINKNKMPGLDALIQSDRDLQQLLVAERSMLSSSLNDTQIEEFLSTVDENFQQSIDRADKYRKLALSEREHLLYEKYLSARKVWEKVHKQIIRLIKVGGDMNRQQALNLSLGEGAEAFESMRSYIDNLEDAVNEDAVLAIKHSDALFTRVSVILLIVSIIAIFTSVFLGYILSRSIVTPIHEVIAVTDRIIKGDFSIKELNSDKGGSKEIVLLTSAISKLATVLREQARAMKKSANALLRESSHMMSATSQLATSASEQASAIAETTATIEELKQTGRLTSENAQKIVNGSEKSVEVSNTGLNSVDNSVADIQRIFDQVEATVSGIEDVRIKVNEVDDIIATVNKIADQSNLLSVNASIEAAKAEEYGRGFAVVAQEVKNLAEQSSKATTRVRMTLESIQTAIEDVVLEARTGRERAETGVASIERTGKIIASLGTNVSEASVSAKHIATSTNANSIGLEQIAQAMTDINQAAVENQQSTVQVEKGGQVLNELAETLEQLVSHYELE